MTTTTLHPLAAGYLDDLRRAGRRLPRSAMRDLLAEIEAHLAETTDADMSDAEVFTALDRLGDPKDIVAAQQPEFALPPRVRGIHEWAAIFLILFGGFIFGVGWIAGLVLLWSSPLWSTREVDRDADRPRRPDGERVFRSVLRCVQELHGWWPQHLDSSPGYWGSRHRAPGTDRDRDLSRASRQIARGESRSARAADQLSCTARSGGGASDRSRRDR